MEGKVSDWPSITPGSKLQEFLQRAILVDYYSSPKELSQFDRTHLQKVHQQSTAMRKQFRIHFH